MWKFDPYASAHALLSALRAGETTAEALTHAYLDRIARYQECLNAVAELNPHAIRDARALDNDPAARDLPLFGLPILVKDNIDVSGLHTTAGSVTLSDHLAAKDAPVIARLRAAGAVILGKTKMTEFANFLTKGMPGGFSSGGGQVRHAYGPDLDPLGSSSGSGVAASAGLCAAAIGTDTSFSVVACATTHGLAGLKPPCGTLPDEGIVPIAHTLDSAGPMTRTFSDALLLYAALKGESPVKVAPADPAKLHIAVNTANLALVSEEQQGYDHEICAALHEKGARFTKIDQPFTPHLVSVMTGEFREDLERYLAASTAARRTMPQIIDYYRAHPEAQPYGISHLEDAVPYEHAVDSPAYRAAMAERPAIRERILTEIAPYDAVLMTGPTNIMHFCGLPSLAIPMCMGKDGAPRGMILYGADEQKLHAAALTIESICPGVTPPIF
ncbi:MAG: amidase [Ruminococcaceae bacterium]|nr:amidase [Oscillospiraceae bacterium]